MAQPIAFAEANLLVVAPVGQEGSVRDLPVRRAHGRITSCWQLSAADLRRIAETGEVWLSIETEASAPPVLVTGIKEDVV